jgi:hypothetical protein
MKTHTRYGIAAAATAAVLSFSAMTAIAQSTTNDGAACANGQANCPDQNQNSGGTTAPATGTNNDTNGGSGAGQTGTNNDTNGGSGAGSNSTSGGSNSGGSGSGGNSGGTSSN